MVQLEAVEPQVVADHTGEKGDMLSGRGGKMRLARQRLAEQRKGKTPMHVGMGLTAKTRREAGLLKSKDAKPEDLQDRSAPMLVLGADGVLVPHSQ